ncbi:MAG: response regulator [Cyanobacteria bacterium P01_D01_bin.44]
MLTNEVKERLILVVEDDPTHLRVIEQAFDQEKVVAIANGNEALAFLQRQGKHQDEPSPDLILLDLNLPGKDGRELLLSIKQDVRLRRIPIIVLTGSEDPDDIFSSYVNQGNCYVIKSSNLDQLSQIVARIEDFWLGIVTLPID